MSYTELVKAVGEDLDGRFHGSLNWYIEVVKLDLEARRIIERIPRTDPQLYRPVAR